MLTATGIIAVGYLAGLGVTFMGECPGVAPFLEGNVRFRPTEKQTA